MPEPARSPARSVSEQIPFVDRFGDAFRTATLEAGNRRPARRGLRRFTSGWRLYVAVAVLLGGTGGALAATNVLSVNSGQYMTSPGPGRRLQGRAAEHRRSQRSLCRDA